MLQAAARAVKEGEQSWGQSLKALRGLRAWRRGTGGLDKVARAGRRQKLTVQVLFSIAILTG